MNLINKKFKTIEDLNSNIFKEILSLMEVNKSPHLILSGGNSPRYLFKIISQNKTLLSRLKKLENIALKFQ